MGILYLLKQFVIPIIHDPKSCDVYFGYIVIFHDTCQNIACSIHAYATYYCITGKIGGEFNLVLWRLTRRTVTLIFLCAYMFSICVLEQTAKLKSTWFKKMAFWPYLPNLISRQNLWLYCMCQTSVALIIHNCEVLTAI